MKPGGLPVCFCDVPGKSCAGSYPGSTVGKITKEFSASPRRAGGPALFISTGSDKGCETLGLSVTTPDKASISFGTTATINWP